jgi:DNA-binding transcriptional LysR family regulator
LIVYAYESVIEHRHLRSFIAVAEHLHFTRAAQSLHVAQPALSQSIRQLEDELGVQLVQRTSRRVELTEAGNVFYDSARRTLQTLEQGTALAVKAARNSHRKLVLGFTSAGLYGCLPDLIRRFYTASSDIQLAFQELTADALLSSLNTGVIDIAAFHGYCSNQMFNAVTVDQEICVLAIHSIHRLAKTKRGVALKQLEGEKLLIPSQGAFYGLYETIWSACTRAGVTPEISAQCPTAQTLTGLVAAHVGMAIIPASIAIRRKNVVYRKILGDPIGVHLRLYWQKQNSPMIKRFLQIILGERTLRKGSV